MSLLREMPVKPVADLVGCHETKLWHVPHHYVKVARDSTSTEDVEVVGIDETSARAGQDYSSLFVDLDVPQVVFATEGRDAVTVERFAADLGAHGGDPEVVTDVCQDMSPAFVKGVTDHLLKTQITFDHYHVIQQLTKVVDDVCRDKAKSRPELKSTRYAWLKRPNT